MPAVTEQYLEHADDAKQLHYVAAVGSQADKALAGGTRGSLSTPSLGQY